MDLGLAGKTAIVTGGGSGIGKAICFVLAQEGAKVAVADLHKDRAEGIAHEIGKQGAKALAVTADVSAASDVDRMVGAVVKEWGGLDVLVNNAGIILQAQAVDMTEPQWSKILTNNLTSCFLCSQAAARQMIKQGARGTHRQYLLHSRGAFRAFCQCLHRRERRDGSVLAHPGHGARAPQDNGQLCAARRNLYRTHPSHVYRDG